MPLLIVEYLTKLLQKITTSLPASAFTYKVAIIIPHHKNERALQLASCLASLLEKKKINQVSFYLHIYSAEGSLHILQNEILWSMRRAENPYNAVITIGSWCSQEVKRLLQGWDWSLPHFYCDVEDARALDLSTQPSCRGIEREELDFKTWIKQLKSRYPSLQTIGVCYEMHRRNHSLALLSQRMVELFSLACAEYDIAVVRGGVSYAMSIASLFENQWHNIQAVCVLPSDSVAFHWPHLFSLCKQKKILLSTPYAFSSREQSIVYSPFSSQYVENVLHSFIHFFKNTQPKLKISGLSSGSLRCVLSLTK